MLQSPPGIKEVLNSVETFSDWWEHFFCKPSMRVEDSAFASTSREQYFYQHLYLYLYLYFHLYLWIHLDFSQGIVSYRARMRCFSFCLRFKRVVFVSVYLYLYPYLHLYLYPYLYLHLYMCFDLSQDFFSVNWSSCKSMFEFLIEVQTSSICSLSDPAVLQSPSSANPAPTLGPFDHSSTISSVNVSNVTKQHTERSWRFQRFLQQSFHRFYRSHEGCTSLVTFVNRSHYCSSTFKEYTIYRLLFIEKVLKITKSYWNCGCC